MINSLLKKISSSLALFLLRVNLSAEASSKTPLKKFKSFVPCTYFEELPGDPLVVDLDLADHVAGHVAAQPTALAPVEPISVLLADNLNNHDK